MNEASRFAERTEVACEEITTAPLTMTSACTMVSKTTWTSNTGGGFHPTWV